MAIWECRVCPIGNPVCRKESDTEPTRCLCDEDLTEEQLQEEIELGQAAPAYWVKVMNFRKKPVVVDAIKYENNSSEVLRWIEHFSGNTYVYVEGGNIVIDTLEGKLIASPGDYIIRGVHGEFYPCKPDIFDETYECV